MDQADGIVIEVLRQSGCELPPNVESFAVFDMNLLVESVSVVLGIINTDYATLPKKVPESKAARFRLATKLSQAIQAMGYNGETGYQAILYPDEQDVRELMIWLMDKLPSEEQGEENEMLGADAVLANQIVESLSLWKQSRWNPFTAELCPTHPPLYTCTLQIPVDSDEHPATEDMINYYSTSQPLISAQPPQIHQLAPSVFEMNASDVLSAQEQEELFNESAAERESRSQLLSSTVATAFSKAAALAADPKRSTLGSGGHADETLEGRFARRKQFELDQKKTAIAVTEDGATVEVNDDGKATAQTEDEILQQREAELAKLHRKLKRIAEALAKLEQEKEEKEHAMRQDKDDLLSEAGNTKQLEDNYKLKKRTLELLPQAEENLAKLKEIADASARRLVELGKEWEKHRSPLVDKYRKMKQAIADRKTAAKLKVEEIKRMRDEMKVMAQEIRRKDGEYKQSVQELKKMPKSINRQVYVRRIMDIVKNLDKQRADIKKILSDVRQVQKDINALSENSQRSFAIVDEIVFKAAQTADRQQPDAKKEFNLSYKHLVNMRENFDHLITTVETVGSTRNEAHRLETQIEELNQRNTSENMSKATKDYNQVKKENSDLAKKVKKLKVAARG